MKKFALTYLFVFLLLCAGTWLIWVRFDRPLTGIDDANIFFVYAKNFVNGYGFVYNAGGERVEGFSSLLWTLVCVAAFYLSSQPEILLLIFNLVILSLGITAAISYLGSADFVRTGESRRTGLFRSIAFLTLLISFPAYLAWNTISLMENAVWNTLLLLATIFVVRKDISSRRINSIFLPLMLLLLLTRPEAFLWVAVFTAVLFWRKTFAQGMAATFREMVPLFTAIFVTIIALTAFRLWYFGYPLPNTYYAKVAPSRFYNFFQGTVYFIEYFVSNPVVSISILATALAGVDTILSLIQRKSLPDGRLFLPVIAGVGLSVPLITGGDNFRAFRFYQGVYPILLLCLFYFISWVLPRYIQTGFNSPALTGRPLIFRSSLVVFLLAGFVLYQVNDWIAAQEISNISRAYVIAKQGREQGRFIYDLFSSLPELPSVGVIRAGGIKYTYPGPVVDLMGLNNLLMAHNGGRRVGLKSHAAFEKQTFYQLQPDLMSAEVVSNTSWQYRETDLKQSWDNSVALKGLYNDAAFLDRYVYAKIHQSGSGMGEALVGWFRREFLEELQSRGSFVIERYEYDRQNE